MVSGRRLAEEREADTELRLHLMGRLPADRLAGLLPRLLTFPADKVATDVLVWARGLTGPATLREYVSAGLRRLLALSASAAVDAERQTAFFRGVADALIAGVLAEDREKLAADAAQLLGSLRPV